MLNSVAKHVSQVAHCYYSHFNFSIVLSLLGVCFIIMLCVCACMSYEVRFSVHG